MRNRQTTRSITFAAMLALALTLAIPSWPGSATAAEPTNGIITAIDAKTGMVTAKEKATGRTFQFQVANQAALKGLKLGQAIHADFKSMKVSLELGAPPCCGIAPLAAIAIPNLTESRKRANEASAIGALRTIHSSQSMFRDGDMDKNGILDYASSLGKLHDAALIDSTLASGTKSGYVISILGSSDSTWSARADPAMPSKTGDRSFFVDESGVIRFSTSPTPASSTSTPLGGASTVPRGGR
jgi:type II secretory pathway pseudopilin PulG/Cu/Ag efflux protein CusF